MRNLEFDAQAVLCLCLIVHFEALQRVMRVTLLHSCLVCLQEKGRIFLVMEYCAGGDLAKFIRRTKRIPEATARALLRQLSAGLRELWSRNLVHVSYAHTSSVLGCCGCAADDQVPSSVHPAIDCHAPAKSMCRQ